MVSFLFGSRATFLAVICVLSTAGWAVSGAGDDESDVSLSSYGADVSFPIHHAWNHHHANDHEGFRKQRQAVYDDFMEGCRQHYGKKGDRCDSTEHDRIAMSLRQPQSMVNYTSTGFKKIKAPEQVRKLLTQYWETHKENQREETWPAGNVYTNHWAAPTRMVSVEDETLDGGGKQLKQALWDAAQDTIEHWTGMELQPTSLYGIRVYTEGAILSPHVDRLPLVSSCIVNVAQDVDEPWPLEIYDRQGNAVNVTMEPGDMVLYESHSLIHGRPFPMKGRYFANIFIHFEPTGRPLYRDDVEDHTDEDFPPYVLRGSLEEAHWRAQNPGGWKLPSPASLKYNVPEGHIVAASGDLEGLKKLAKQNRRALHKADENGWQPLHESVRSGHLQMTKSLIEDYQADVNARTNKGKGGTPLFMAVDFLGADHPVTQYLQGLGATNVGPEL